jgi:hypothetical protein
MPKRTKKLLVYLDQNFISELAKAEVNNRVKPEWKELYELLKEGFLGEKLVVPQSWFHDIETSLAPELKERIVSYQNYLGQVDLHNSDHVRNFQIGRFFQRFTGQQDKDPLDVKIAFRDHPDQRVKPFNITVNTNWAIFNFQSSRMQTMDKMEDIHKELVSRKVAYKDQLEKEYIAQRDYFYSNALTYYEHLSMNPREELLAFGEDSVFRTIPVVSIYSRLWSWILTKFPTRAIQSGDATDIDVLSTYMPYVDVIGTDTFMATQLEALGIDKEYQVSLFTAKTPSLRAFCTFLREYLKKNRPVNRPALSIFVLPSPSIKAEAFKFFFELGKCQREVREPEWVDVYGFDDGQMPRYQLRGGKVEVSFYGLQDVEPLPLPQGANTADILGICRERCKSDKFFIIDEYRPFPDHFLLTAIMHAESGMLTTDGYPLYSKDK